jgi:hypothetical protein
MPKQTNNEEFKEPRHKRMTSKTETEVKKNKKQTRTSEKDSSARNINIAISPPNEPFTLSSQLETPERSWSEITNSSFNNSDSKLGYL